jgi:hypothetical protein
MITRPTTVLVVGATALPRLRLPLTFALERTNVECRGQRPRSRIGRGATRKCLRRPPPRSRGSVGILAVVGARYPDP